MSSSPCSLQNGLKIGIVMAIGAEGQSLRIAGNAEAGNVSEKFSVV